MQKFFCGLIILLTVGSCGKYDHGALENEISDLKDRVATLEQWATTVNSNISALQNIVAALQNMDYVTGVTTFTAPAPGGYVISFVKSGSITIANGADGTDGTDGTSGTDGTNGESPQISVKRDTDGVYYWTLNGEWITADGNKMRVAGENGADGSDGQNGVTPQLRVNAADIWEVSYDGGVTWSSLGVTATGEDGQNGQNGVAPQLRINSSNILEASYDGGNTWTSLGGAAEAGSDGQDGITPKIRINTATNEWEISYDNGAAWETTGIKATGEKGEQGEAVFADNAVDYSNSEHVEFTLADGVTKIQVPKYKKIGLNYTQPGAFVAGQSRTIGYTTEGKVSVIKFLNMPSGWTANVDYSAHTFTFTAPATFNSSNSGGEVIVLVSDNDQNTIMRTINLNFTPTGGGSDDGGGDDGGDDGGSDDGGGSGGDDEGTPSGPAGYITIEGYQDNTITVYYTNGTLDEITKRTDNPLIENYFSVPINNKIIKNIVLEGGLTVIAGRKADGSVISLKVNGVNLTFRDAVAGFIPIGTYSELNLVRTALGGSYKQETDIDMLNAEWAPIGNSATVYFSGIFDGDNHTLANLKISGNNDYVGLFGSNRGYIYNVHIISGLVSGKNYVGGICGHSGGITISGCSNASSVSGSGASIGGVCGAFLSASYSTNSYIINCHNTGSVLGSGLGLGNPNVGGVCGYFGSDSGSSSSYFTDCYNTGSVSGGNGVGGVCGTSSSSSSSSYIRTCYNTGSVSGSMSVGGVCGNLHSDPFSNYITACYNTGSISGHDNVGGISGYAYASSTFFSSSYVSITACYNTGSVSGSDDIGGINGYAYSSSFPASSSSFPAYVSITACYNTGSVSGSNDIGGINGYAYSSSPTTTSHPRSSPSSVILTACYWKDITGDNADYGSNNGRADGNTGTAIFAVDAWPGKGEHTQWGTGDGSGDGKYWKSLGGWNGGNPTYPKLWFEE